MKRACFKSWHFVLILAAVVLLLTDRSDPSAPPPETLASTWHVYFSPHGGVVSPVKLRPSAKSLPLRTIRLFDYCDFPAVCRAAHLGNNEIDTRREM
jgi:hypothetical protein